MSGLRWSVVADGRGGRVSAPATAAAFPTAWVAALADKGRAGAERRVT